jgi:ArsR family metal-binding transcriptional regulator
MKILTTFATAGEFEKAKRVLESESLPHTLIMPRPGFSYVGLPALVIEEEDRGKLLGGGHGAFSTSGWVDYHKPSQSVPGSNPPVYEEDVFGIVAIMVLQPCTADLTKLRTTAHFSGDLAPVFPYMNALMRDASYNAYSQTFTFMEGHRMIALYPHRVAIAKTNDIVDTWRVIEMLRVSFNECWKKRADITPSNELRKRPPALEIYYRLPKLNCGECGEKTCMAFALQLWSGQVVLTKCKPVFGGTHGHMKEALVEICGGLGVEKE